ncbi:putative S-adenosyl-L-methionine-dependent methyltransferase [Dioscorea sansibarensis]
MARRYSSQEEALEIKSLRRIVSAYLNYSDAAEEDVRRYERTFAKLSPAHKDLLSHLPVKYKRLRWCISVNTFFIMSMLQAFEPPIEMNQGVNFDDHDGQGDTVEGHLLSATSSNPIDGDVCSEHLTISGSHGSMHQPLCGKEENNLINHAPRSNGKEGTHSGSCCNEYVNRPLTDGHCKEPCDCHQSASCSDSLTNANVSSPPRDWLDTSSRANVPLADVDKVRCIIRNIVRDWTLEGRRERDQCYKPILKELDRLFPSRSKEQPPSCLVPGAGLGRLALEISCLGFVSQGNEFSYYMMICSSFILNHTQAAGEWTIYPWIHNNCNSLSDDDQLRPVSFPDIHPASAGITEGFSMCGGDFVEVYNDESQKATWDAVVTCFFLDTAHNIVEYIEIISNIIKDGGVWINMGPLLYHFADAYGPDDEMSVELSLEDVKKVAFHYGFELEVETTIETAYSANPRSMMQNRYFAPLWTMKKKQKP